MNIRKIFQKKKEVKFLCVGDMVADAFIQLKQAEVTENINHDHKKICMAFGEKIPFESVTEIFGVGNSANASISLSRLGIKSFLLTHTGDDFYGNKNKEVLEKEKVNIDLLTREKNKRSNYHYVLWFNSERTILINHEKYDYRIPKKLKNKNIKPDFIYISSLGENTLEFHNELNNYLNENPNIRVIFQPGTFQMKFGIEKLKYIYERTEFFFCNREESMNILNTENNDIKFLLNGLKKLGIKLPVITDGPKGSYTYDEDNNVIYMPIYPDIKSPLERTGAGDAFASTFSAAKALGKDNKTALMWGSINSMSVCQYIGAQAGLLSLDKIEEYLKNKSEDWNAQII